MNNMVINFRFDGRLRTTNEHLITIEAGLLRFSCTISEKDLLRLVRIKDINIKASFTSLSLKAADLRLNKGFVLIDEDTMKMKKHE